MYFVAFSRAQDVLLLVGLCDNQGMPKNIPNVATGWTRDEQWPWQGLPSVEFV
jgi:DNA helicase-2/ATP-dependent DNA helicase PcrA